MSKSSKAPAFNRSIFPPSFSSFGVPKTVTCYLKRSINHIGGSICALFLANLALFSQIAKNKARENKTKSLVIKT